MALTIHMRRTGAAAHRAHNASAVKAREAMVAAALRELRAADPEGWEAWYDANVPEFDCCCGEVADIICRSIARMLRDRAEEVKKQKQTA